MSGAAAKAPAEPVERPRAAVVKRIDDRAHADQDRQRAPLPLRVSRPDVGGDVLADAGRNRHVDDAEPEHELGCEHRLLERIARTYPDGAQELERETAPADGDRLAWRRDREFERDFLLRFRLEPPV